MKYYNAVKNAASGAWEVLNTDVGVLARQSTAAVQRIAFSFALAITLMLAQMFGAAQDAYAQTTDPATTAATQIATLSGEFTTIYTAAFTVMIGIVVALVVWKYARKLGLKV